MSLDQLQLKELDGIKDGGAAQDVDTDAEHKPQVARNASNAGLKREAVQMKGNGTSENAHEAAEQGKAAPATALPHQEAIQRAFGAHDVSGIQAHTGEKSAGAMGAQAYATGNHVMFGDKQPDLHTAAHEAAHVVQQSKGVNLRGGVGQAGDEHEQRADEIADRVVAGKSAEDLLGAAGTGKAQAQGSAVQMKDAKKVDAKDADAKSDLGTRSAISSSLLLQAKHLHQALTDIRDHMAGPHNTEAGREPAVQSIGMIFDGLTGEAARVSALIGGSSLDKLHRSMLTKEYQKVLGAYQVFQNIMPSANQFTKSNGDPKHRNPDWIKQSIDGYAAQIGLDEVPTVDRASPAGDESAVKSSTISEHVDATMAAVTSTDAGNAADAARVSLHARELHVLLKNDPSALKAHKAELKALSKALEKFEKSHPEHKDAIDALQALVANKR